MSPFSFRKACWSQVWASRQGMARAGLHSCLTCNECQAPWSGEHGYQRWQKPAMNHHPSRASREETASLGDDHMNSFLLNVSAYEVEELSRHSSWSCPTVSQYQLIPLSLNKLLQTTRNGISLILCKINTFDQEYRRSTQKTTDTDIKHSEKYKFD